MKKHFISAIAFVCLSVAMMAQIPNSGFENWTSMGTYDNPDGWGTLNNTTAIASVYTVTKATPGSPGNYYMKITSRTIGTAVAGGIAVSGRLDSMTMQPMSGFAYNQRPANFTGKWQHMIYGTSQGSVMATLTRWDTGLNQRVAVATASVTLSGMAMSWATFTLPFTYADGGFPDTCIIVLKASGANPTNNDYLWVDNLAFTGSVAGIADQNSLTGSVQVYPSPAKDVLTLELNLKTSQKALIELMDLTGKTVSSQTLSVNGGKTKQVLDISGMTKGVYLLKVSGETGSELKKVVIE